MATSCSKACCEACGSGGAFACRQAPATQLVVSRGHADKASGHITTIDLTAGLYVLRA